MSIPYCGKKDPKEIQSYKNPPEARRPLSNNGQQGKKGTRRRVTNRPFHRCDACKFFFNIGRDDSGAFFLMSGKGNCEHNGHGYGTTEKVKLLIKDRLKPDTTYKIFYGDQRKDLHNPRFILGYWSIRGLGAPLRMMLSAADVNHWAILYDMVEKEEGSWGCESFMKDKVWLHKEYSPLVNLPFLIDCEHDQVISQANAIYAYLGRKLNMLGDNEHDQAKCEELLCEIMDLRNIMVGHAYQKVDDDHTVVADEAKRILDKLEIHLEREYPDALKISQGRSKICHLVGWRFSSPDFHLWEMLDQFHGYCQYHLIPPLCTPISRPYLYAFKDNFESLTENSAYLRSRLMLLPYNNPYAQFGNIPLNYTSMVTEYIHGQGTTWRKQGIVEEQRTSQMSGQKRKHPDSADDDALITGIL
jgi:glutathione S-transferase